MAFEENLKILKHYPPKNTERGRTNLKKGAGIFQKTFANL